MSISSNTRIVALDGVRAFCILFVIFNHASRMDTPLASRLAHVLGDLGVRGFFVLSGFLITSLLQREPAGAPAIVLRDFYIRRALRIFPAFYTFLGGALLMFALGWISLNERDAWFAATYTMNFHAERAWSLGHLWSLAVEEQFYLLWPAVLLLLKVRRASGVLLVALVVSPLARIALYYAWPAERPIVHQAFPCVFDALATGCLLAIGRSVLERDRRYVRFFDSTWFWLVPLVSTGLMVIATPWFQYGIATTAANLGIAMAIHRCVARPATWVVQLLRSPILVRIGVLSYSIYLWQQVFINRHSDAWFSRFPLNLVCTFAAALISHYVIEVRFLKLTPRFRAPVPHDEAIPGTRADTAREPVTPEAPGRSSRRVATGKQRAARI